MATLMTLPLEIREMILSFVLLSTRPTPGYPDPTTREPHPGNLGAWNRVKWPTSQTSHPAVALLRVCHQLHCEARLARKRLGVPRICHVDVSFVNEAELWPSFLSLHIPSAHLETVRAQIRTVGLYGRSRTSKGKTLLPLDLELAKPEDLSIWMRDGIGLAIFDFMFLALIEQFLLIGPSLVNKAEAGTRAKSPLAPTYSDSHITISTLEINVHRPEEGPLIASTVDEDGVKERRQPKWLCERILRQLDRLFRLERNAIYWTRKIYEQVGTVKVFFEGKFQREFHIAKMFCDPELQPVDGFHKWRARIIEARRKNGLPVVVGEEGAGKGDCTT